jgi:hypothetical protein
VKSRHVRLAENGLRQRPQEPRRELRLRLPVYLDGTGARVAPPLTSSLHLSFHCRGCLLALYCGRLGASEAGEGVVASPGTVRAVGLVLEPGCGLW